MILRRLALPILASTFVVTGSPAAAEPDVAFKESVTRFNEGKELMKQRRFAEAHVKFVQSCAAYRTRNCPKNLGVTEYELGMFADAATHLEEYLADEGSKGDAHLPGLRKMLDESLAKCGHVSIDAPAGATIAVDEQPIGKAPIAVPIHVTPGTHSIRAALTSGKMLAVTVTAEAGKSTKAVLKEPDPPVAPAPPASSAPPPTPVASATASAAAPPMDQANATPFWSTRRYIGVAVVGAGVLSLAAGGYFGGKSHDDADRAAAAGAGLGPSGCTNPAASGCADVRSAQDAQSRDNTLSAVFIGVGVVALAAGVGLVLWPQSKSSPRAAIVPIVSAQGGALQLRGEF